MIRCISHTSKRPLVRAVKPWLYLLMPALLCWAGPVGAAGQATVASGAKLTGVGAITGDVLAKAGGTLSPGLQGSTTCLTVKGKLTLSAGATLNLRVTPAAPCKVPGGVVATGAVTVTGAKLVVDLGATALKAGETVVLVGVPGTAPATGTFAGLAEGAVTTLVGPSATKVAITYKGGDGNDIAVRALVDECADAKLNDCDANAACTDTALGFTCACKAGFSGDGKACKDVDECADAKLNTCDANAACTNTAGAFTCACNAGYAGDGKACCPDPDADTVCTADDNCPAVANTSQDDFDKDGVGDACECTATQACDDGNVCTTDGCDPKTGCTNVANGLGCDDGDPCTANSCVKMACAVTGTTAGCCDADDECKDPAETCVESKLACTKVQCLACAKDEDCGQGNACVALTSGSYCLRGCKDDPTVCGADAACQLGGQAGMVCLPKQGDCQCVATEAVMCSQGDVFTQDSCGAPDKLKTSCDGRGCVTDACCPVGTKELDGKCVTSGGGPDAGPTDAGSSDAGSSDAGSSDAGSSDAGSEDGGATTDAGVEDGGGGDDVVDPVDVTSDAGADSGSAADGVAADGVVAGDSGTGGTVKGEEDPGFFGCSSGHQAPSSTPQGVWLLLCAAALLWRRRAMT